MIVLERVKYGPIEKIIVPDSLFCDSFFISIASYWQILSFRNYAMCGIGQFFFKHNIIFKVLSKWAFEPPFLIDRAGKEKYVVLSK